MNKIITPVGKASFPYLLTPRLNKLSNKPEYSVDILFDKKTDLKVIKELIDKAIGDKWGEKKPKLLKLPIKDGDGQKPVSGESYGPEYRGCYFITLKNTRAPGVVNGKNQPIIAEEDIYGGCLIRASTSAYAYDRTGNKGVSLSLLNVQKVGDGEPFGGGSRTAAEDEFDIVDDESDNPNNYIASSLLG